MNKNNDLNNKLIFCTSLTVTRAASIIRSQVLDLGYLTLVFSRDLQSTVLCKSCEQLEKILRHWCSAYKVQRKQERSWWSREGREPVGCIAREYNPWKYRTIPYKCILSYIANSINSTRKTNSRTFLPVAVEDEDCSHTHVESDVWSDESERNKRHERGSNKALHLPVTRHRRHCARF